MDQSKSVPTGEGARNTTTTPTKNIVETVINAGTFTTFAAAINAAGLTADLGGKGPLTVFAPTCTIEFEDGSDAEIEEGLLSKCS